MDVARPYAGIATAVDGEVLIALMGWTTPRSGRHIARLVGRRSQTAVNAALARLVRQGLVQRQVTPAAMYYTLNREHVGYPAVAALAGMRTEFLRRLRELLAGWAVIPAHASMFGSAARGDGDADSDVDLVVVLPQDVEMDDARWRDQLAELSRSVLAWTGNRASIVELDRTALADTVATAPPVLSAWRHDVVPLAGQSLDELLEELP